MRHELGCLLSNSVKNDFMLVKWLLIPGPSCSFSGINDYLGYRRRGLLVLLLYEELFFRFLKLWGRIRFGERLLLVTVGVLSKILMSWKYLIMFSII